MFCTEFSTYSEVVFTSNGPNSSQMKWHKVVKCAVISWVVLENHWCHVLGAIVEKDHSDCYQQCKNKSQHLLWCGGVFLATLMPKHTSLGATIQTTFFKYVRFLARQCKGPFCMLRQQCRLKVKVCGGVLRPLCHWKYAVNVTYLFIKYNNGDPGLYTDWDV